MSRRRPLLGSRPSQAPGLRRRFFGSVPPATLARRAAGVLALGLLPVALQLGCEAFALLYGLQLGLGMVLIGTTVYARDQRGSGRPLTLQEVAVAAGILAFGWLVILLMLAEAWSADEPVFVSLVSALKHVDGRVLAAAAVLAAWAVYRARVLARQPVSPDGSLDQPVTARALCVVAFMALGPYVYELFRALGASEPLGVALAYGLSEAYPFLATLVDRGLDRVWPA